MCKMYTCTCTDHNISKSLEDVPEFIDTDVLGDIANKQRVSRLQEEYHTHSQCMLSTYMYMYYDIQYIHVFCTCTVHVLYMYCTCTVHVHVY